MKTLSAEAAAWVDSEKCAQDIKDRFDGYMETDLQLLEHRLYIEEHGLGFGERCFHWLWRLIIDAMPTYFRFLKVGVYKGQVLSLVKLLADRTRKHAEITGVTMLSPFSGTGQFSKFPDEDYGKHIKDLHDRYKLFQPRIIVGDSTDPNVCAEVATCGPFDIVYIDGCHEYDFVVKDLMFYPGLVRTGGLLVMDDCSNYLEQPQEFFRGIGLVNWAVRIIMTDPRWKHLLAVAYNRVWRMGAILPADYKLRDNRKRNPA